MNRAMNTSRVISSMNDVHQSCQFCFKSQKKYFSFDFLLLIVNEINNLFVIFLA